MQPDLIFLEDARNPDFHEKSFSIVGNLFMFLKTQWGETKGISGTYLVWGLLLVLNVVDVQGCESKEQVRGSSVTRDVLGFLS